MGKSLVSCFFETQCIAESSIFDYSLPNDDDDCEVDDDNLAVAADVAAPASPTAAVVDTTYKTCFCNVFLFFCSSVMSTVLCQANMSFSFVSSKETKHMSQRQLFIIMMTGYGG